MDIEDLDRDVNNFLDPLIKKGYTILPGNADSSFGSLDSQLRGYIISSIELEPYDYLKDMIADGKSESTQFKLNTYNKTDNETILYTFHCEDRNSVLSLKKLDVSIDSKTISIPIFNTVPSPELAKELHEFKFPKLNQRSFPRNIMPEDLSKKQGF